MNTLLCGAPSRSETSLLFCNDLFSLWLESVQDDIQLDLTRMADKADGSVVLAQLPFFGSVITRDRIHVVGHSPVFQIW